MKIYLGDTDFHILQHCNCLAVGCFEQVRYIKAPPIPSLPSSAAALSTSAVLRATPDHGQVYYLVELVQDNPPLPTKKKVEFKIFELHTQAN